MRQFRNTSSAILSAQMQQLQFFANARRYESAHAALNGTEVPVEIYHNLIASVRQNLPAMHRYVKLRKLLGVNELHSNRSLQPNSLLTKTFRLTMNPPTDGT